MLKLWILLAVLLLPAVVLGQTTLNVRSCRSTPLPSRVSILGCYREPCRVRRGSNVPIRIEFSPPRQVTALTASVRKTVLGITTPFALPNNVRNVCLAFAFPYSCPLRSGRRVAVRFQLPIRATQVPGPLGVQLTLNDQNGSALNCFQLNLNVRVI